MVVGSNPTRVVCMWIYWPTHISVWVKLKLISNKETINLLSLPFLHLPSFDFDQTSWGQPFVSSFISCFVCVLTASLSFYLFIFFHLTASAAPLNRFCVCYPQALNFIFERARPFPFCKGHFLFKILKSRGTKAKTKGNVGSGLHVCGLFLAFEKEPIDGQNVGSLAIFSNRSCGCFFFLHSFQDIYFHSNR